MILVADGLFDGDNEMVIPNKEYVISPRALVS